MNWMKHRLSRVEYQVEKDHVVLLSLNNGQTGLFYSANVVVEITAFYKNKIEQQRLMKEYWRSRSEDIETAYNLLKSSIERADKKADDYEERIKMLSDALTRSKEQEKKLLKRLNANSKSRIR
jgi:hypothetical protein